MGRIKNKNKDAGKYIVSRKKTKDEIQKDEAAESEKKFYWTRALSGVGAAIVGRVLVGLIGWDMLIWMVCWWFGFPWIMSFIIFRIPYEKKKWDWKKIMKTGVGIYFFLFMVTATICHTFMAMPIFEELFHI
jgi:hypothetical protein